MYSTVYQGELIGGMTRKYLYWVLKGLLYSRLAAGRVISY